jgi:hypothetical protein
VYESRMLRRIFGHEEGEEVTLEWRKLHTKELHNLYFHLYY